MVGLLNIEMGIHTVTNTHTKGTYAVLVGQNNRDMWSMDTRKGLMVALLDIRIWTHNELNGLA